MAEQETKKEEKQIFNIQRIYLKETSFHSKTPESFKHDWKPEMKMDIHTNSSKLEEDSHEVILTLSVNVTSEDKEAFKIVVKQAGIFNIKGFEPEQIHQLLGSFCPSTLYPYAREAVSSLVSKGSFPQLNLAPINFDALYMQHVKQEQENAGKKDAKE